MTKARVLLLCGGQSGEHEVSIASARSVLKAAGEQFSVSPVVISKSGKLLSLEDSQKALGQGSTENLSSSGTLQTLSNDAYDVVFPLLHGPNGEDGSIQGMLKLMGLKFVGSDILGSAVGMDKLMMKSVFAAHDLPQIPYKRVLRSEWLSSPEKVLASLEVLTFPLFVKPANLGSSVGISKARNEKELVEALNLAAQLDRRIIVEQGLEHPRELEVGVLGNDFPELSPVGEISFASDFYDYETKYTEGRADLVIPASIDASIAKECQELALKAFAAIDGAGLARVDFFFDEPSGKLYLNEINTMPGFTTTSMYPKLWEAAGVSYGELIVKLVNLALEAR
ncbi:MAG: D-alanine--D-alanine ligase [Trueperaceae bacterium]|nr:D-alanine--D-alanine ligase [Trueperaceae bacterium]